MTKPLIILLSQNPRLTAELASLLEDRFQVRAGRSLTAYESAATNMVPGGKPAGLVADFSQLSGGGHAEVRFLEELRASRPELVIVMLTAADCPEPLERTAACGDIAHLRGPLAAEQVAGLLRNKLSPVEPADTALADEPVARSGKPHDEIVLQGITRQFETFTPRMAKMLDDLEVAARHTVTILLIGETGSGKTFLSRLIHEVSPRRDEPFLTVACGALPGELIESELFGHVKGAFTSAHADKEGKFVAAGRGTVLLDEIDVLSPEQQVKLLRVIETGEFEPVGSNRTLKSQARLVVASNLDLQPLVEQGRFRPDLYYRLNMLKFEVLPLRERRGDVIPLAKKFIGQLSERHGIEVREIDPGVYDALLTYPWPGNVRELENVIQRAVIYCRDGRLTADHLPAHILAGLAGPTNDPSVRLTAADDRSPLGRQIAFTEREIIEQALFKNNFSRTNTAKELGISRVTLYNKMKKYGMSR